MEDRETGVLTKKTGQGMRSYRANASTSVTSKWYAA